MMASLFRFTCAIVSAVTVRGYNAIRTVGALPSRYFHWSDVLLSSDKTGQCEAKGDKIVLTDEEWKKKLSPEQYYICRQKGTEPPFSGEYYNNHRAGVYTCACCGAQLFSSKTKYESGSGWPSFYDVFNDENGDNNVVTKMDTSHGMVRVEVLCRKCDSHLGHVFDDGPPPTNQRYCINSASLSFTPDQPET